MSFYHTLLEQYAIMESLDSIIASNPHIPKLIISGYHKDALPDNNKKDRLLNHVLKMHDDGDITPETAHLLKPHLTALSNTNQLHQLKHLNTLDDHINATKDIMDKSVTKKERVDSNTPVIANTPNLLVRQHLNHESAIKGARLHSENPMYKQTREPGKAQWCLSLDNDNGKTMFDHYTEKGKNPVFTIFNKGSKRSTAMVPRPTNTYVSNEIRNETDKLVTPYKLLKDNPGIEHVKPIMDHINTYMPEVHDVIKQVPFNANKKQIVDAITSDNKHYRNATFEHDIKPYIDEVLPNKNAALHLLNTKYPLEPHHIDKLVGHDSSEVRRIMAKDKKLEPHHIDALVNDTDPLVRRIIAKRKNLEPEHIDALVNDSSPKVRRIIATNKSLIPEHIDKLVGDNDVEVRRIMSQRSNLEPHHIDALVNDTDTLVRKNIAYQKSLEPHHIDKLAGDDSPEVRSRIVFSTYLEPHHIDALVNDTDPYVRSIVAQRSNLEPHHIDKLADDTDIEVRRRVGFRKDLEPHHVDKLAEDDSPHVRQALAGVGNLEPHHVDKLAEDDSPIVRESLTKNKSLEPHHIDKLVNDTDPDVRTTLARRGDLEPHHLDILLNDDEPNVVNIAARNNKLTKEQMESIVNGNDIEAKGGLAYNRSISDEHVDRLMEDDTPEVRNNLAYSGNMYEAQLHRMAHNDNDAAIRKIAKHFIGVKFYKNAPDAI
jgi:hypothetical protein